MFSRQLFIAAILLLVTTLVWADMFTINYQCGCCFPSYLVLTVGKGKCRGQVVWRKHMRDGDVATVNINRHMLYLLKGIGPAKVTCPLIHSDDLVTIESRYKYHRDVVNCECKVLHTYNLDSNYYEDTNPLLTYGHCDASTMKKHTEY